MQSQPEWGRCRVDPEQIKKRIQEEAQAKLIESVKTIGMTEEGAFFLTHFLEETMYFSDKIFVGNSSAYRNLGRRDLGQWLLALFDSELGQIDQIRKRSGQTFANLEAQVINEMEAKQNGKSD